MLLRPAQPDDALDVARVHVCSWQAAYRGLLPDAYLDQLRPEDRAQRYDFSNLDPKAPYTIVAVEAATICGFATTSASRDPSLPSHGELCALYVDPAHWGSGYGIALVAAARGHLERLGFHHALLWVLAGNARAERFYQNDGWTPDGSRRTDTVWDIQVDEIRYQRSLWSQSI